MSFDKGIHTPVTFTVHKVKNIYITLERLFMPTSVTFPAFIPGNQYLPDDEAQGEFGVLIFAHSVIPQAIVHGNRWKEVMLTDCLALREYYLTYFAQPPYRVTIS